MSDPDLGPLFEDDAPAGNAPEFTVSELSGAVKRTIEGGFAHVRVRGEVGRVSRPRSGHVYLDLKDEKSVLAGVIWKGQAAKLTTQPEEGLEVIATGRLTTFAGQSRYQIVIESLAPAGMGALMAMLEKRRKALEAEGLFADARKRPLPYLPEVIGVVTSPSGAVIRDILHRLRERFPRKVLIWPVAVQGEKCAPDVARAIAGFNALSPGGALPRPDLLIVARGGGSLEDLWGFNEEAVVRAAAASEIPLISAVGHETDTTLIDHAADRRAPTPTAAAEMAVPVRADLLAWTGEQGGRLTGALARGLSTRGQRLRDLSRALPRPADLTQNPAQRLDLWADRLPRALVALVSRRHRDLAALSGSVRPTGLLRVVRGARDKLSGPAARLATAPRRLVGDRRRELDQWGGRLNLRAAERARQRGTDDLARAAMRLDAAFASRVGGFRERLDALERLRASLGYEATLSRGFAVIRSGDQVVTHRDQAAEARELDIQFRDGILSVIPGDAPDRPPARPPTKRASGGRKVRAPKQGSLFEE
ncbi:MAG: exodeoxyribonuclease VII large subunit [Pseudomonadota bacterium]